MLQTDLIHEIIGNPRYLYIDNCNKTPVTYLFDKDFHVIASDILPRNYEC